jgi:hypothetical protein
MQLFNFFGLPIPIGTKGRAFRSTRAKRTDEVIFFKAKKP